MTTTPAAPSGNASPEDGDRAAVALAAVPRSAWRVCLALFVGTLLLFGHAATFEFVNIDDYDYVVDNPGLRLGAGLDAVHWAFTNVQSSNWHPLTWLSHALDVTLFGYEPGGHHAVNVLWHAVNGMLAFLMLRRATGAFWTSAACAALFAWHPVRAESVAWVSERKDVLSAFFFLLSLWAWAGYARVTHGDGPREHARGATTAWYLAALLAFALGLLAKAMLVTLPFVLLLLDVWPFARLRRDRLGALLVEKLPFFALTAASAVATYLVQDAAGATFSSIPVALRLANAAISVVRHAGALIWPFGLSVLYPYPASWPAAAVVGAVSTIAAATALATWQVRRRPWILVGWLWFLGMLVPVIGLVQVGVAAMADRYTYLPVLGLQISLLWTLRDWASNPERARIATCAVGVLLLFFAVRTWQQVGVWRSSITLFSHATEVTDANYLAYSNLGMALAAAERFPEAERSFRRVLEIDPPHFPEKTMRENDYMVRYALAVTLLRQGRYDEAGEQLARVLELVPDHLDANSHYGVILAMQGKADAARARFETALQHQPASALAHGNLARLDLLEGNAEAAVRGYRRALELVPSDASAHCGLAQALAATGDLAASAQHRAEAVRLTGNPEACGG
ncbi:MAG: tetratricopeptide repeat protein [Deltaproteobacteria bacterium]|nr:tetratricopeptide repeat protein [Deltaproteobacteria bacterium]